MRILATVLLALTLARCGPPAAPLANASPAVIGPAISCDLPRMARHCEAWVAAARRDLARTPAAPTAAITGWTVHLARRAVPGSGDFPVAVEFHFADGRSFVLPLHCGASPFGDPGCDLSDVTLPTF